MVDARLSAQWDQVSWLAVKIVRSNAAKPRRVKYENPYDIAKSKKTAKRKTSGDYKVELLDVAKKYVAKQQAG